jgi:hypothetical protein
LQANSISKKVELWDTLLTKEGKLRYKLECNRAGGKFIVREIKVPKDNSWRDKVADLVMQVNIDNILENRI